jgi:hypothetical protein
MLTMATGADSTRKLPTMGPKASPVTGQPTLKSTNASSTRRTKCMMVAYTLNGKCYDRAAVVNLKVPDGINLTKQPLNTLCFYFDENSPGKSKVTLNILGIEERERNQEVQSTKISFHSLGIECWTNAITTWRSHPLDSGTTLPGEFNAPKRYVTTDINPKRIIYFQVTRFNILGGDLPDNLSPSVERQMKETLSNLQKFQQKRIPLRFMCIVN